MKELKINMQYTAKVRDEDNNRCDQDCDQLGKVDGMYNCLLFDEVVDNGDDENSDYLLMRCKKCISLSEDCNMKKIEEGITNTDSRRVTIDFFPDSKISVKCENVAPEHLLIASKKLFEIVKDQVKSVVLPPENKIVTLN